MLSKNKGRMRLSSYITTWFYFSNIYSACTTRNNDNGTTTLQFVSNLVPSWQRQNNKDPDNGGYSYMAETCKQFYRCWKRLDPYGKDFAFLTLGQCAATGKNRFNPRFPETVGQCGELLKLPYHNYAFAVPSSNSGWTVHAVNQILRHLQAMKQWTIMRNIPVPLDVYLFTYSSPCRECTRKISNIKDSAVHVTWIDQYRDESAVTFFENLETLFEKSNIHVLWKVDNDCRRPTSYQHELYKCLTRKIEKVADCSDIEKDLAKFVNKLMFECLSHFPSNNMTACKDNFIAKHAGKVDNKFKYQLMLCMQNLYMQTLGPPLDPEDPTWGSQNVTDLNGDYPEFCFK